MSKIYLTTVFHCNLNYSSIAVSRRKEVIDKCYWPILNIAETKNIKLGFEFSGRTLEIIKKLDPDFLEKIKQMWQEEKIEVIGSGYVQAIFPLIPADVNLRNLKLGNRVYKKLLGKQPKVAFVNEQTYSAGVVELYLKAGYKAIIVDWPNAAKNNNLPNEEQYKTGFLNGCGKKIRVIWNNCLAFQKLQRYAYSALSLKDYLDYVTSNYSKNKNRCFMVYGNDTEVFNFRARDPKTLHSGSVKTNEIKRIENAFVRLKNDKRTEFVFLSECLKINPSKNAFRIETAEHPIISKKQDKYNVTRWAVCGKENYKSNSLCYEAYYLLKELDKKKKAKEAWWNALIWLWASDYRTFTTNEKWNYFRNTLLKLIKRLKLEAKKQKINNVLELTETKKKVDNKLVNINQKEGIIETKKILLQLSRNKGGTIKELVFKDVSQKPLLKILPHGYFDDISYAVDLFSGHTIAFSERKKITDLSVAKMIFKKKKNGAEVTVKNSMSPDILVEKKYFIPYDDERVDLNIEFIFKKKLVPLAFRTFNLTPNPEAFSQGSLYYKTTNGGNKEEIFHVKSGRINHSTPVELHITSRQCLGSTEGKVVLGDAKKELIISTNKALCYTAPMIYYEELKKSYYLRIHHSLVETDETTNTELKDNIKLFFSITARKK